MSADSTVAVTCMGVVLALYALVLLDILLHNNGCRPRIFARLARSLSWWVDRQRPQGHAGISCCPSTSIGITRRLFPGSDTEQLLGHTEVQQRRMETKLGEIRVESYRWFFNVWMHVLGVYAAIFFLKLGVGLPRVVDAYMAGIIISSYTTALVLNMAPNLLRVDILFLINLWNGALGLAFGAYLAFTNAPELVHHYSMRLMFYRIGISVAYPVAWVHGCWNVAWAVVAIIAILSDPTAYPKHDLVSNELLIVAFFTYAIWQYEILVTRQVRTDFLASGYLLAKRTMERLLAEMCDAVVELDGDLDIRQPCPKLAGLLLKHTGSGSASLQGDPFAGLTYTADDCERFIEYVTGRAVPMEPDESCAPRQQGSLYVNLKDAAGTAVSVQIFHSCHHDPLNELCHVVGVREVERANQPGGAPDTFHEGGRRISEESTESSASASSSTAGALSAGVSSAGTPSASRDQALVMAPLIPEQSMLAPESVLFNPMTNEIIATAVGFQSLTGPLLYKQSMRDLVVNFQEFRDWVHDEVNGFYSDQQPTKFGLRLAPSTGRREANLEFHAEACIVDVQDSVQASEMGVEQPAGVEQEAFEFIALMVLGKIEPQWKREKHKHSRRKRD